MAAKRSQGKRKPKKKNVNKRLKKINDTARQPIKNIHSDLVTEVLARVAATSFDDLINAKLSCKMFNEVGDHDYITRHVSLQNFEVVQWRPNIRAASFLDRCRQCGNPEALYRQAVIDFFDHAKFESSTQCLRRASELGHMNALYALAIILIFSGDESKQMGMQIFMEMNQILTKNQLRECRKNLKSILSSIWIRNTAIQEQKPNCCMEHRTISTNNWNEVDIPCGACKCDHEIIAIFNSFYLS